MRKGGGGPAAGEGVNQNEALRAIAAAIDPIGMSTAAEMVAGTGDTWPYGFAALAGGLHYIGAGDTPPQFLASPFAILGFSRDAQNGGWGLVLRFQDRDGVEKTVMLASADLIGDGAAVLRRLASAGLVVAGRKTARDRLLEGLIGLQTSARVRLTDTTGWDAALTHFVTPDRTYGGAETFVFENAPRAAHFGARGTLAEWQAWVDASIKGHDRLLFAVTVALSGPLLGVLGGESAIWHVRGKSSSGKSTALRAGASVWGPQALVGSWRGTANGFEGAAALNSDLVLVLDELGLADARSVSDSVYMLVSGTAKSRMASDGSAKAVRRWRTTVLSSGEISLADKLGEEGRRGLVTAGQGVRFIELPVDPTHEMGVFDGVGSKEQAAGMADAIKAAAAETYGTAGPAFLEKLVADVPSARREAIRFVDMFMDTEIPDGADGQVTRVARKFATVAAAGELAVQWGILPPTLAWGDISEVASRLFSVWLGDRGGAGATEDRQAILRVKSFLATNASARLPLLRGSDDDASFRPSTFRAQMVAGYQDAECFYLNDGGFKEALGTLELSAAADALSRHGYLLRSGDAHRRKTYVSTPEGRQRLYRIKKSIMEFDDGI